MNERSTGQGAAFAVGLLAGSIAMLLLGKTLATSTTAKADASSSSSLDPQSIATQRQANDNDTPSRQSPYGNTHRLPDEIRSEMLSRNSLYFSSPPSSSTSPSNNNGGMDCITSASVLVVGLGGVGSHAAHMLARAGVGRLRLVDFDQVTLSSLNRHAVATLEDVGLPKATVLRDHLRRICPDPDRLTLEPVVKMYTGDATRDGTMLDPPDGREEWDVVIDAIDDVPTKAALIASCARRGVRVVSCMGAGGKADPTRVHISDLRSSSRDPLAAAVRQRLRVMGKRSAVPSSPRVATAKPTATPEISAPTDAAASSSTGGMMDILAEITSHAPPLATPSRQANNAYSQNGTASIPSYQEIYASQQQQQPQHHQAQHGQVQQPPHQVQQSPSSNQRVSAIPSYQEIYREMGLSPQQQQQKQRQRQPSEQRRQHFDAASYEVEEVRLEHAAVDAKKADSSSSATARTMSHHYTSRSPGTRFGHVGGTRGQPRHHDRLDGIEEGKELYTRKDLVQLGGHLHEHKDVHGNMREGCDSLIVGCLEKDIREADGLLWFFYSADRPNGGGALCQSYHKKRPVRVFRSSLLGGKYAPPFLDVEDDVEEDSDVAYRYDGLYMVRAVWDANGHETESFPVQSSGGGDGSSGASWQTYFFVRAPRRPLEKERIEAGTEYNGMGCQELWGSIQKMRGVRRPKKFEIPTPPVKLGPLKRAAVSGLFGDRKCPGYVRPEPVVPAPPPPKPVPPPRSKSPRTVSSEKQQQQQKKPPQEEEEEGSESSSEEGAAPPSQKKSQHQEEDSDSDSSDMSQVQKLPQHHPTPALPLSAVRTPSKVLTPRPRMNSVSQSPKKTSPPTAPHDDSSDSETESTTASLQVVNQRKRRKPTPSPKMKLLNSTFDHTAFFPKRASAARAEAANREVFKRKTSETHASTSSATAATKAAATPTPAAAKRPPPPRTKSTRKRAKVASSAADYDSSSSSSSADPSSSPPDVVDQSILTVGSRVLVVYKGSLFKASIRKRREKNGRHDFLIHYDGNKRTNVHWVPIDRISEILEINVDTPPKKKAAPPKKSAASRKRDRRRSGGSKRKAPAKQESLESIPESLASVDVAVDDDEPKTEKALAAMQESMESQHSLNSEVGSEPNSEKSSMLRQASLQQGHYDENEEKEEEEEVDPKTTAAFPEDTHPEGEDADEKMPTNESPSKSNGKVPSLEAESRPGSVAAADRVEKPPFEVQETDARPSTAMDDTKEESPVVSITKKADVDEHKVNISDQKKCASEDISEAVKTEEPKISKSEATTAQQPTQEPKPDSTVIPDLEETMEVEEEVESASVANDLDPEPTAVDPKPFSANIKTTTAADATARKPRKTVVSDICHANSWKPLEKNGTTLDTHADLNDPLLTLAMEAEADISDGGDVGSVTKESDENNSTSSSGNNAKLEQPASELTSELKYPVGCHVYVEYRQIFYSSKILKTRKKRSVTEYLVHYEGYKKSSNRWVKENGLHEVNTSTTQRYEEQRFIPAEILYESEPPPDFSMVTRTKKASETSEQPPSLNSNNHSATQKKLPAKRLRSDASDAALLSLESGVDFLPGSMVFVEWSGALYLAKMLKKRYSGERTEYWISYDGYKSSHDAWVSILKIYEVNPQTKRVFKQIMSDQTSPGDGKHKQRRAPPGPKRRETRKKSQDDEAAAAAFNAAASMSRTRNNGENNNQSHQLSRGSSRAQTQPTTATATAIADLMQGIEPGVEFLPGSTLFAEYKGGLCLAKMLKKRGRGDYMEYYIQYNGPKKAEETWVSTTLVYEINPQTKRMFRKLAKT